MDNEYLRNNSKLSNNLRNKVQSILVAEELVIDL